MGEINVDRDNAVELTALKIQLEAVEDKIIVVMDTYKSGYECEVCKGTGRVKSEVVQGAEKDCETCKGKGALLIVPEVAKSLPTLGTIVSVGEKTRWAQYLKKIVVLENENPDKQIISSGEEKEIKIRPGAKILFQPHVGTLIPFKGNVRLKIMREHEPLCVIYGSEIDAKNFMDFDVPFEERY